MPKTQRRLTEEELLKLKYISMADFSKRIDNYDNINDKLAFATKYLILHGIDNGEADCSIIDAINIARMKIADASAELRKNLNAKVDNAATEIDSEDEIIINKETKLEDIEIRKNMINPYATVEKELELKMFMGKPLEYLKIVSLRTYNEIADENIEIQDETKYKNTCLDFHNKIGKIANVELDAPSKMQLHINNRLETVFGGKAALEKAYKDTQAGFFSRMFTTSSTAGRNLGIVYKAFNDPEHVMFGNINELQKAATDYLQHKFPDWEPGKPYPKGNELNDLDSTEKGRSIFSIAILDAIDKEKINESCYDKIVDECSKSNYLTSKMEEEERINQEIFQRKVQQDVEEQFESNNDMIIDKGSALQKEDKEEDLDESRLDKTIDEIQLEKRKEE